MSTTQTLTFGPGRAPRVNVLILIVDDTINEGIEQFFARLAVTDLSTDADVELNPNQTIIEIIDNDCKIQCLNKYFLYYRSIISSFILISPIFDMVQVVLTSCIYDLVYVVPIL